MKNQKNLIKSKAKQLSLLLDKKGIKIKHTQSLEIISRLIYNKPWHSIEKEPSGLFLQNYFNDKFKDKLLLGINEKTNKIYSINQLNSPNTLLAGASGSGKSNALKFSLITHIMNNSENTIYCFIDLLSGMSELSRIINNKNYSNNIINLVDEMTLKILIWLKSFLII